MSGLKDIRRGLSAQGTDGNAKTTGKVDLRKLHRVDLLELLVDQIRENDRCTASIEELTASVNSLKAKVDEKDAQIHHLILRLDEKDAQIERLISRLEEPGATLEGRGQRSVMSSRTSETSVASNSFASGTVPVFAANAAASMASASMPAQTTLTSNAAPNPAASGEAQVAPTTPAGFPVPTFQPKQVAPEIRPVKPVRVTSPRLGEASASVV